MLRHQMAHPMQVKLADSEAQEQEAKLFIGLLPASATEEELIKVFSQFGDVESTNILRNNLGKSKG